MPQNSSLIFLEPQPIYRTSTRLKSKTGDIFDIAISGDVDLLKDFVEHKPIHLELVQQDVPKDVPPPQERRTENPQAYPSRALDIQIRVAQTSLSRYTVKMTVDPDLCQGCSHYYYLFGAGEAWANCQTTVGDADLHLSEWDMNAVDYMERTRSVLGGTTVDGVYAAQQTTGIWRLQVYGFAATNTYTLTGMFGPFGL